jgi:hypothetical protein
LFAAHPAPANWGGVSSLTLSAAGRKKLLLPSTIALESRNAVDIRAALSQAQKRR